MKNFLNIIIKFACNKWWNILQRDYVWTRLHDENDMSLK